MTIVMSSNLPDLKRPAFHVVLPRWPRDGDDWIHPDDRCLAQYLFPGDRVFRCEGTEGEYNVLSYGHRIVRLEPVLWLEVPEEGLRIGDQVEVLSRLGKNWPRVGFIREMRWHESQRRISYQIRERTRDIPTLYTAQDLRRIEHFDRSYAAL
jgi:hypothetical protein